MSEKLLFSTNSSSNLWQRSEFTAKEQDWKPRLQGNNALIKIPKIIIQTLKDKKVNNKFFSESNHSITTLHPGYDHMVLDDLEQKEWVRTTYPLIYPFFANFTHDIHRSDFVRFLLIFHYGGFYFDSDVIVMQEIDKWYSYNDTDRQNISVLVGIEGHNPESRLNRGLSWTWRPRQVTSWAFAAEPRHPLFDFLVKLILSKRVAHLNPDGHTTGSYEDQVAEFASPAVLTDAITSYLLVKGVSFAALHNSGGDKIVDGIYLADVRAFSCGTMWSESILFFFFLIVINGIGNISKVK
jgi:mannosyltransferase OCH1-like enzyme